jgi:hypothetical protein
VSYQGQTWVDEVALPHLKNGGELLVMLRVANHAGNGLKKMSGCHAAAKTLAKECLMGRSTVLNHLRNLAKRGLLVPGDPALVAHLPADKRPPVYDLGGAHEPGCIGGHTYFAECQRAGVEIEHPNKTRRSAGAQIQHPVPEDSEAGAQIETERVLKSSTNSSKELKEFSPLPGASPSEADPSPSADAEGEREAATQNDNDTSREAPSLPGATSDTDKVVDAYVAAYMTTAGLPPRPDAIRSVRAAADGLLSVGRSVGNLCTLAAELGVKGWADLVKHAQMNPEAAIRPAGAGKPWCGQCNDGREPASSAQRMVETTTGMAKCHCHPGYIPHQTANATA